MEELCNISAYLRKTKQPLMQEVNAFGLIPDLETKAEFVSRQRFFLFYKLCLFIIIIILTCCSSGSGIAYKLAGFSYPLRNINSDLCRRCKMFPETIEPMSFFCSGQNSLIFS